MSNDVIIIGAGVSGLATACALGQQGFHVTVLDKALLSFDEPQSHPLRFYALNAASKHLLQSLNAWPDESVISPYREMFIWDEGSNGQLSFAATEFALPDLGHIVAESAIKIALLKEIARLDTIELVGGCHIEDISVTDGALVHCDDRVRKAKLLIAADGANSWVKKKLNFKTDEKSYAHHAIVATVTVEEPHQQTAFQRFTRSGPLAFLPLLNDKQCSIVYSCDKATCDELMSCDDDTFLGLLSERFEYKLGRVNEVSERISFPLTERHCKEYVRPHVALIADAIHTIHPLAGLGLNLGLKDVASLVKVVTDNRDHLGEYRVLRTYERERKGHNTMVLSLMGAIKNTYALSGAPATLRGFGMGIISSIPLVKKAIIKKAMML